jgi:hypothetical protein
LKLVAMARSMMVEIFCAIQVMNHGSASGFSLPILNLARSREVKEGDLIHESALKRIQAKKYNPWNLSRAFKRHVESLPSVPPVLGYFKNAPAGAPSPNPSNP